MVKIISLLLLSTSLSFSQSFTFFDTPFLGNSATVAAFVPTDVSGMALYWNYTDLSAGAVSTWTDRIQGLNSTQSGTKRPTKDANGVLFSIAANTSLTNVLQTGTTFSNVTMWVGFKLAANDVSLSFESLLSDGSDGQGMMIGNLSQNSMIWYPRSGNTMWTSTAGVYYDWVLLYTNSAATFNRSFTNGVSTGVTTSTGINDRVRLQYIGNDAVDEPFGGYIKFIGVWTNKWLTAANIVNLTTYSSTH